MHSYLKSLGKDHTVINPDKDLPNNYSLFDTSFLAQADPLTFDISEFDLLLGLDIAVESQVCNSKGFRFASNFKRINIDHHENSEWGNTNLVLPKRFSTTSILYTFFQNIGYEPNLEVKTALVAGYLSDSGVFRHGVQSDDLRFITDMLDQGVDVYKLIWLREFSTEEEEFRVKVKVFDNVVIDREKNVAWSKLSLEDIKSLNLPSDKIPKAHIKESDSFKDIKGIKCAIMFKEKPEGYISVSLRSNKLGYNVSKIAQKFGGGGHIRSSGFILKGVSLDEAIKKVLSEVD